MAEMRTLVYTVAHIYMFKYQSSLSCYIQLIAIFILNNTTVYTAIFNLRIELFTPISPVRERYMMSERLKSRISCMFCDII